MTLIQAVQNNDLAEVLAQISAMVDLNTTDSFGKTAIMYTVEQNSVEIFNALFNAGAVLNGVVVDSNTSIEILKTLQGAGFDISASQSVKETSQNYYDQLSGFGVFPQNPKIDLIPPQSDLSTNVLQPTTPPTTPQTPEQSPSGTGASASGLGDTGAEIPPSPVKIDISQFGVPYSAGQNSSPYPVAINIQPMVANITLAFFQMDSTVSSDDAKKIQSASTDDKLNEFMKAKGLPSFKQPGLVSLLETFMKMIADAIATFGGYVIALLNAVKTLIDLLKNPTDPQNIQKIADTVSGLKTLIQSVVKFVSDTKQWMFDTFMGPLAGIKIPSPMFVYNLGEVVPAFPFPIPIPPLNPSLGGVDDKTSFDLTKLNPADLIKMNLLFNTPYLDKIDTNPLVEQLGMSNSNTELAAQQLKAVQMVKNVASFPIKLLVGFMNTLLSAILGAISFNFSKIGDLIKMLTPTMEGLTKFSGTIIDSIIPNFSKVFDQMEPFIKNNKLNLSSDADIAKLTDFTKNIKVNVKDVTAGYSTMIETKVADLNQSINDLSTKKDNFKNLNPNNLNKYLRLFKQSGIADKVNLLNQMQSNIFIPDVISGSDRLKPVYDLYGAINSIDSKQYDNKYNIIPQTPINENAIVLYYSGATTILSTISGITDSRSLNIISKYYQKYNTKDPNLRFDIEGFMTYQYNYLTLKNKSSIDVFFTTYDNTKLTDLLTRFQNMLTFNQITNENTIVRYNTLINSINETLTETIKIMNESDDFNGDQFSSVPLNDLIERASNNYDSIQLIIINPFLIDLIEYTNVNLSAQLSSIGAKLKSDFNNFKTPPIDPLFLYQITFTYEFPSKNTIIESSTMVIKAVKNVNVIMISKETKYLFNAYFFNIQALLQLNLNFPANLKTTTNNLFNSINDNTLLIKQDNTNLLKDFQNKAGTTLEELKKNSLTPPNTQSIGDNVVSYVNTMKNFPTVLLQILKAIFDFVLSFLPF